MDFGEHHQPESLVGESSLTGNAGHYFDMRTGNLVDTPLHLRHYLEEIQNNLLSQIAVDFRSLHERLDGIEEKLETALRMSPANLLHARLSGIEANLNELLTSSQKPPPNSLANDGQPYEAIIQTPVRRQVPDSSTKHRTDSDSIINALSPTTPVSQLPSEENAKVKVLLRQFAASAMSHIEKNASTFTNVNNHVGAISTMKKFGIYDSPTWDNFAQLHFPHVLKSDLVDELVKIVSVKVKNTKARYKKVVSDQ
ncbi:hypothetical protein K7432_011865 [Basidiobolus ranarum]|uniref:Uncharacterized protein n=1 Tax=Basidiobolus ranarum TaxID=34480 RepID=A0ABR2WLQ3_9FUNG